MRPHDRRMNKLRAIRVSTVVVLAAGIGAAMLTARSSSPTGSPVPTSAKSGVTFLSTYVGADGRVIRRDQGGDTVSEGQAYALLLAVSEGDRAMFDRVLSWTDTHLRRSDGLYSWRWRDGAVLDPEPASDADLDAATALVIAARRFGDVAYAARARELAAAILTHETFAAGSSIALAAGPWAVQRRVLNPSYTSPAAFAILGSLTGDPRWDQLSATSRAQIRSLTEHGAPPDWAMLVPDGRVQAAADSSGSPGAGAFGFDAARVTIRWAMSCDAADRAVAALDRGVLLRDSGAPLRSSALGALAVAGAARASGDSAAEARALQEARSAERRRHSYYGSAWIALYDAWATGALPGC